MILRAFLLATLVVLGNGLQLCPEQCRCTDVEATCTSLNVKPFKTEMAKLKIVNSGDVKLSAQVLEKLGLGSVKQMYIENSTITELDPNAFLGHRLSKFIVKNTVLPEIPAVLFEKMPALRIIQLDNCSLTNFVGLQSSTVQEINISGCKIHNVHKDTFEGCPKLTALVLANNLIENFTTPNIPDVEFLNLSNNNIKYFQTYGNKIFDTLDLSYNPIERIDADDTAVEILNLKSCNLKNIDFIEKFQMVVNLDLSDNQIRGFNHTVFNKLLDLETLELSNNKLTDLPKNIFKLNSRLKKLSLDGNQFTTLPVLSNLNAQALEYVSCKNCKIQKVMPDTFRGMVNLHTLILKGNDIKVLPKNLLKGASNLVKIDLSSNSLTGLNAETFMFTRMIKNINLSHNPLRAVNTIWFKHTGVADLDISGCQLKRLWEPSSKYNVSSLKLLNAEHNEISAVTVDELNLSKNLVMLNLGGNPLECGTTFTQMRQWLKKHFVETLSVKEEITLDGQTTTTSKQWLNICGEPLDKDEDKSDIAYDVTFESNSKDEPKTVDEDDIDRTEYSDYLSKDDMAPAFNIYQKPDDPNADFLEDVNNVMMMDNTRFSKQLNEIAVFLLLPLIFILTALVVLSVTVTIILCILCRRNKHRNAPQIKILPWSTGPKLKKHSGSVYRPLSEEKIPI